MTDDNQPTDPLHEKLEAEDRITMFNEQIDDLKVELKKQKTLMRPIKAEIRALKESIRELEQAIKIQEDHRFEQIALLNEDKS